MCFKYEDRESKLSCSTAPATSILNGRWDKWIKSSILEARTNSQYNFTEFKLENLRLISKLGLLGDLKNPTNTIFIISLWWIILHINLAGLGDTLIAGQTLLGYACEEVSKEIRIWISRLNKEHSHHQCG